MLRCFTRGRNPDSLSPADGWQARSEGDPRLEGVVTVFSAGFAANIEQGRQQLSPLDHTAILACINPKALWYASALDPYILRASLSLVLKSYPCFAGRLVPSTAGPAAAAAGQQGSSTGHFRTWRPPPRHSTPSGVSPMHVLDICKAQGMSVVFCNAGVPFRVVHAPTWVMDDFPQAAMGRKGFDSGPMEPTPRLPPWFEPINICDMLGGRAPVLSVRLTQLGCGGCILALTLSHALVDGRSACGFLSFWAATYRQLAAAGPLPSVAPPPPAADRTNTTAGSTSTSSGGSSTSHGLGKTSPVTIGSVVAAVVAPPVMPRPPCHDRHLLLLLSAAPPVRRVFQAHAQAAPAPAPAPAGSPETTTHGTYRHAQTLAGITTAPRSTTQSTTYTTNSGNSGNTTTNTNTSNTNTNTSISNSNAAPSLGLDAAAKPGVKPGGSTLRCLALQALPAKPTWGEVGRVGLRALRMLRQEEAMWPGLFNNLTTTFVHLPPSTVAHVKALACSLSSSPAAIISTNDALAALVWVLVCELRGRPLPGTATASQNQALGMAVDLRMNGLAGHLPPNLCANAIWCVHVSSTATAPPTASRPATTTTAINSGAPAPAAIPISSTGPAPAPEVAAAPAGPDAGDQLTFTPLDPPSAPHALAEGAVSPAVVAACRDASPNDGLQQMGVPRTLSPLPPPFGGGGGRNGPPALGRRSVVPTAALLATSTGASSSVSGAAGTAARQAGSLEVNAGAPLGAGAAVGAPAAPRAATPPTPPHHAGQDSSSREDLGAGSAPLSAPVTPSAPPPTPNSSHEGTPLGPCSRELSVTAAGSRDLPVAADSQDPPVTAGSPQLPVGDIAAGATTGIVVERIPSAGPGAPTPAGLSLQEAWSAARSTSHPTNNAARGPILIGRPLQPSPSGPVPPPAPQDATLGRTASTTISRTSSQRLLRTCSAAAAASILLARKPSSGGGGGATSNRAQGRRSPPGRVLEGVVIPASAIGESTIGTVPDDTNPHVEVASGGADDGHVGPRDDEPIATDDGIDAVQKQRFATALREGASRIRAALIELRAGDPVPARSTAQPPTSGATRAPAGASAQAANNQPGGATSAALGPQRGWQVVAHAKSLSAANMRAQLTMASNVYCGQDVMVTSWQFPYYDVDFGQGGPKRASCTRAPLGRRPPGRAPSLGGMLLQINTPTSAVHALEHSPVLKALCPGATTLK